MTTNTNGTATGTEPLLFTREEVDALVEEAKISGWNDAIDYLRITGTELRDAYKLGYFTVG